MNLFNVIYIIWIASEIILNRSLRSAKTDKHSTDKHSELYIWIAAVGSIATAIFVSFWIPCLISTNASVAWAGIVLIIIGIIFRFMAIKQLGRFFTVDVTIREGHQLMQKGFYKYVRHPSYAASLLSFFGFGLSVNNWISLGIVFISVLATFIYRMNVEEGALTAQFGEQYKDYIRKTKRLIPFIY
jgi:protein-S-isoprenylcysteine O-methyltransferase Ste14